MIFEVTMAGCGIVVAICAARMAHLWLKLTRGPYITLRAPSGRSWCGKSWRSHVWYDEWGTPYARGYSGWGFEVQLRPLGGTSDTLYEVQWRHISGPEVEFDRAAP